MPQLPKQLCAPGHGLTPLAVRTPELLLEAVWRPVCTVCPTGMCWVSHGRLPVTILQDEESWGREQEGEDGDGAGRV